MDTIYKLTNSGNYEAAIALYKEMIETNPPNIVQCYSEMGALYQKQNKFFEAITQAYIKLLNYDPYNIVILNEIGVCYSNIQQNKLAIHYFKKVIKIKEIADVYCNMGLCSVVLKDYIGAEECYLNAYRLSPRDVRTLTSLGELYYFLKKYDTSIQFFKKSQKMETKHSYNMSFSYLAQCDFKTGFELYEHRLKMNNINPQTNERDRVDLPAIPYWDGKVCDRLLVVYEQGIGDNIQFYRFVLELTQKFPDMKIGYFCREQVKHFFVPHPNIQIITHGLFLPYQYKTFILSLPFHLNVRSIKPVAINYIYTNPEKMTHWKEQFSVQMRKKLKIGFFYSGRLSSFIEKNIPLEEWKLLSELDIDLICLHQKSEVESDLEKCAWKDKIHTFDIDTNEPFEDTITILQNIDLLITIDTSVVHLAGVLGVKTWLLLGKYSEWRWSNKNTTYWYDSVELIRMNQEKPLKDLMSVVAEKLEQLLQNSP